jgi:hypothetical protein
MWFYITNYNFTIWCVLHNKYNGYNKIWFYITKIWCSQYNMILHYKIYVQNMMCFYITNMIQYDMILHLQNIKYIFIKLNKILVQWRKSKYII